MLFSPIVLGAEMHRTKVSEVTGRGIGRKSGEKGRKRGENGR